MDNLFEELRKNGCDTNDALLRLGGREALYKKVVISFLNDQSLNEYTSALSKNNLEDAYIYVHNIKGVAGNLGFTPLYIAAATVVKAFVDKEYDKITSLNEELFTQYDSITNLIKANS